MCSPLSSIPSQILTFTFQSLKSESLARFVFNPMLSKRFYDVTMFASVHVVLKMASQSLKLGNIKPENAIFFLCDIQEKFRPVIKYFKEILEIAEKLVCLYSLTFIASVLLKITYMYTFIY